jgi:hypothetical protein
MLNRAHSKHCLTQLLDHGQSYKIHHRNITRVHVHLSDFIFNKQEWLEEFHRPHYLIRSLKLYFSLNHDRDAD